MEEMGCGLPIGIHVEKKAKATWFREKGWARTGWLQLLSHVLQNIFFELRRAIEKVVWKTILSRIKRTLKLIKF